MLDSRVFWADYMMAVNVKSALYCTQAVLPQMKERGHGHIVSLSSMLGRAPQGREAPRMLCREPRMQQSAPPTCILSHPPARARDTHERARA